MEALSQHVEFSISKILTISQLCSFVVAFFIRITVFVHQNQQGLRLQCTESVMLEVQTLFSFLLKYESVGFMVLLYGEVFHISRLNCFPFKCSNYLNLQ